MQPFLDCTTSGCGVGGGDLEAEGCPGTKAALDVREENSILERSLSWTSLPDMSIAWGKECSFMEKVPRLFLPPELGAMQSGNGFAIGQMV